MVRGRATKALSRKNIWEALPRPVKTVAGAALGRFPVAYLLGSSFRRHRALARQADRWSADEARDYQLERCRRICRLAYEQTPYYRRSFDEVGFDPRGMNSLSDLRLLLTIDKHVVRDHLGEMCTVAPTSPGVDFVSTGGTGGEPLNFYIGAGRSAVEYAHLVTSWGRAGYRLGTPMAVIRGRIVPENRSGLRHEYDPLLRHHYYSNFHMTDANMERYLRHIAGLGPCYLHVYPSSVAALARYIRRSGSAPPANIGGIIAESENVYAEQRSMVEETFGCRYLSCYGHSEKLVGGAECEHSTDYHIWPTYGFFELLDSNGDPVTTPGERGEIVGTGFINTVMPFIRYRTGDFATYMGDRCPACGREQVIIADIRGHNTQEFLIAQDGSAISWTALNMHDDTFANVRQFQFHQEAPGQATLRVVPAERFGDRDSTRIQQGMRRKLADRVEVSIELAEVIPLSPMGKMIYVDQELPAAEPSRE